MGWAIASIAALTPALALGSDQELAQQIAGNLKNSGRLKGYSISVKVQGSVVQLDGSVRSDEQLEQALAIAEVTPGIERVVNNLSVKETQEIASSYALRQPQSIAASERQTSRRASRPTVRSAVRQATAVLPSEDASEAPQPQYDTPPQMPTSMHRQNLRLGTNGAPRPIQRTSAINAMAQQPMPRPSMPAEMIPPGPLAADNTMDAGMHGPIPAYTGAMPVGHSAARFDRPQMPAYAWPSYAAYPNYAALSYPKQYSPTAWPFIGPFYPYPQVPLGWRKVSLEWDNGWWMLDFKDSH
jgi:hypothetical protein